MANLAPLRSDLYRLDDKYSVRFSFVNGRLDCVWHPHLPSEQLLRHLWQSAAYVSARDHFGKALAEHVGGPVFCNSLGD